MASSAKNVAAARRWFEEVWNRRSTQTVHELLGPDAVGHTEHGDLVGPQPFLDYHARLVTALPDLTVVVEDVVAEGDHVVVRWRASGTHAGPFGDKPATGRAVRFRGMTWMRFRGGKLAEGWDAWDAGGLLKQLEGNELL